MSDGTFAKLTGYCIASSLICWLRKSLDSRYVDEVYQGFCYYILQAEKRSIPRGHKNNYRPCWNAECESLYQDFLKAPSGEESNKVASDLLFPMDIRDFLPFFLFAPTQNFQDLEKSACGRDPKTRKARGGPKELSTVVYKRNFGWCCEVIRRRRRNDDVIRARTLDSMSQQKVETLSFTF